MSAISRSFTNRIYNALSATTGRSEDWRISDKQNAGSTTLSIRYLFDSTYWLRAVIPNVKDAAGSNGILIKVSCFPGELTTEENVEVPGADGLLSAIGKWTERVIGEINSSPVMRQMESLFTRVEELSQKINIDGLPDDQYFTREEVDALREQLEEWKRDAIEELKKQAKAEAADLERRVNDLEGQVQDLKQSAANLSKKGFGLKIATFLARNAAPAVSHVFMRLANSDVTKFLPPGSAG